MRVPQLSVWSPKTAICSGQLFLSPLVLKREQYLLSSFCENFHNSCKQKGDKRQTRDNTDWEQPNYHTFSYAKQCLNASKQCFQPYNNGHKQRPLHMICFFVINVNKMQEVLNNYNNLPMFILSVCRDSFLHVSLHFNMNKTH